MEGIGFVALVASLIFVGLETRNSTKQSAQNTQAMEIGAYQELISNIAITNSLILENHDAAEIMARNYAFATDVQDFRQFISLVHLLRHGDMAFFMFEKGVIDEERLRSTLRPLPLGNELGQEFWDQYRYLFVSSYQSYIDNLLAEEFWITPDR